MRTVGKGYSLHLRSLLLALVALGGLLAGTASAQAAPAWRIDSVASTTAAAGGPIKYQLTMRNGGDSTLDGSVTPITFTATFPAGIKASSAFSTDSGWDCTNLTPGEQEFTCVNSSSTFGPGFFTTMIVEAEVDPGASGVLISEFEVAGGDPANPSDVTFDPTRMSSSAPPFGIDAFDGHLGDGNGAQFTQAGGHPDEFVTSIDFNTVTHPAPLKGIAWPVEPVKDLVGDLPPGFLANPESVARCTIVELAKSDLFSPKSECPPASQVGTNLIRANAANVGASLGPFPVFNMVPPAGHPARLGFNVAGSLVFIDAELRQSDYGVTARLSNVSEGIGISGSVLTLWGNPADEKHRLERACAGESAPWLEGPNCAANAAPTAFIRMPTACTAADQALSWPVAVDSWFNPGAVDGDGNPDLSDPAWSQAGYESHEAPGNPLPPDSWGAPRGVDGCEQVPVEGELEAEPTTRDVESSSGLQVHVEVPNPGLENPEAATSTSDLRRVEVALPQGMTINPSQAEGLGVCAPAQYESTELSFFPTPGKGCPDDSKIGTVSVRTPILEETLPGSVYVAEPYANPFNSLLAIYVVIAEPERGILVKLPGEIRTNERTGQIEAEFDDLPQAPFSTFDFKFREGARAPLVTPPTCGTYETVTEIEGHSDPGNPIVSKSRFVIDRGIGGGPCPTAGTPSFKPGFSAGSINNNAGSYSPFVMRLTRKDGEQDMTRFSAVLPPGVLGKLAGVSKCPDSAIAQAKARTGPHGGMEEIDSPSCPANSLIGRSTVGAGVGSVLTYVPGKVYLGGPFNGRPLSVIAVTPVVAGPFDVGTVVVQEALTLNPKTAEVEVDGSASDPIPHILKGIPAKLRDLRVYVDRPEFILNPTNCDPSATDAELFGGGGNAFTSTDDVPILLSDRFQAASCAALGFKPKLGLKLKGGTTRGDFPGLQATYRPRPGDANVEGLVVRLPRSAFLEQGHIRTICTRVQFAADACPKGSQYGYIKAWTPLLEEPLAGPVYLRSSNHKLPDLVFDLHGLVDVEVATRIDSVRGGVRASVDSVPDAPLSKVVLRMQGGKKGLIVNSRNLCSSTNKANVESDGHNGKVKDFNPVMKPDCRKRRGKRR